MNYIISDLDAKAYLRALKACRTGGYPMFSEGVTGIVIGPFFSIAYYSPYEWNRRITHECNRAWGYVKDVGEKTEVRFIRGKGMLTPFWVVFFWIVCFLIFLISGDGELVAGSEPVFLFTSLIAALFVCVPSAIGACYTEEGIYGEAEINRILTNPKDYYCYR